jgi:hypothetical protein
LTRWLRRSRWRRQRTSMAFPFTFQGDISHTLTLRNSVARRFSHLETTRCRSHNRQLSKDFTKTVGTLRTAPSVRRASVCSRAGYVRHWKPRLQAPFQVRWMTAPAVVPRRAWRRP